MKLQERCVPSVVRLLGYDRRARQLYLPLLQPLAQYLGRRSDNKSALVHAAILGMLEGVAKLHEHRVCHRDLKIDNVLVAGPPSCGARLTPTPNPNPNPNPKPNPKPTTNPNPS